MTMRATALVVSNPSVIMQASSEPETGSDKLEINLEVNACLITLVGAEVSLKSLRRQVSLYFELASRAETEGA